MKKIILSLLTALITLNIWAQVTATPASIANGYTGKIKIIFNPAAGNKGMASATECYAHTGLITVNSESDGDWKYTVNTWRDSSPKTKMTKEGSNWVLTIDNMYTFYGCPTTEGIKKIAFVFNDGKNGSKEGKAAGGGDIFVNVTGWEEKEVQYNAPVQAKRPAGVSNGIYYGEDGTSVTLCTYAASKTAPAKHVFVIGDFTNWEIKEEYQMKQDGNYFWLTVNGLTPGKEYAMQYMVVRADGNKVRISDLYSEKVLHSDDQYEPRSVDPTLMKYPSQGRGYVTVIQPGRKPYTWSDATLHFQRPDKNNLVIYEVWVYDYTPERSIPGLMERLDYIENLGVNAIELMPVCEFDGNYNWGYSPNHYFALDKAYGTMDMYKAFIDECHRRGIAVIMDMVFNHATGNNPMNKLYPYGTDLASNPWFNVSAPHGDNVYEDWNHDFAPAQEMFSRALQYWLTEYKVDGFRMDLSHGFCGTNCSNLQKNLETYHAAIKSVSADAYFIQEFWGDGGIRSNIIKQGMLCWTGQGLSDRYAQLAMGYSSSSSLTEAKDGFVAYNESHDEERNFYKAKQYGAGDLKTNEEARIRRVAAVQAFNTLLDGSHMIWQYGELGYDYSINSSNTKPNGTSGDDRCSKKPRIEKWITQPNQERMNQYRLVSQIVQLRTRLMPKVFAGNPTASSLSTNLVRSIQWGSDVYVVANFSATDNAPVALPSGTWYDYLGGAGKAASNYTLAPGEVKVFTGTQVIAPTVPTQYNITEGWIDTITEKTTGNARKLLRDGQLIILTPDAAYDIMGHTIEL